MDYLSFTDERLAAQNTLNPRVFENAKVLIVGASGLIGSLMVKTLHELNKTLKLNISITAASRNRQRLQEEFSALCDVSCIEMDINHPFPSSEDATYDYIFHAASQADPASFKTSPVETMLSNIEGTRNLLDLGRHNPNLVFTYISSGEVYGETTSDSLMRENMSGYVDPVSPRSCYPSAKRASETLCASYTEEYFVDTRIVRPSHVYGPGFRPTDSRISADFFLKALHEESIILKSPGADWRTYIYVADCVSGILSVASSGLKAEAYNVTNSANRITMRDFAKEIAKQGKVNFTAPPVKELITGEFRRASALDDSKLRSLGWKPIIDFNTGVKKTFKTLRSV